MIEKPIIENDYYDPLKSLQHSKNKNLAHQNFRFTHSQIERIEVSPAKAYKICLQNAQKKNSFLDCSPNKLHTGKTKEQIMDLRPRNKVKEIAHATFKHSATTRFEQVYD